MGLVDQIYEDLREEIEGVEGSKFDPALLMSKVKSAYRDVQAARRYPLNYTEAVKEQDMMNYYSQIRNIAMYDFNQTGAEGQKSYHEDGVTVHFLDRNSLFSGILPISKKV